MAQEIQHWTRERVVQELRDRSGDHRSIKFSDSEDDDVFKEAITTLFGSWTEALGAAGLHPKTKLLNYWNEREVVRRLKEIADRGDSINTLALELNHPRLWNAARRIFGNINNAVRAAGYDYGEFKKRGAWTADKISSTIRQYFAEGRDLTQIAMLESDSKLLAAAQKLYGAWSRAVRAAGIDYKEVKERHRETKRAATAAGVPRVNKMFIMRDGKLVHTEPPPSDHPHA